MYLTSFSVDCLNQPGFIHSILPLVIFVADDLFILYWVCLCGARFVWLFASCVLLLLYWHDLFHKVYWVNIVSFSHESGYFRPFPAAARIFGTPHEIQTSSRDSQDITCIDTSLDRCFMVGTHTVTTWPQSNTTGTTVNWGYHQLQRSVGRVCLQWFVAQPLLEILDDVFENPCGGFQLVMGVPQNGWFIRKNQKSF